LGLTTGLWIHTLLVIFGVGNILKIYPESQRVFEIIGGSYLLFLALNSWRAPMKIMPSKKEKTNKLKSQYFFTGLVMNLTNPKVSLFFLSFFPGFIFHQDLSYSLQFFILGSLFFLQALVLFCMVSLFADAFARKLKIQKENTHWNKIQSLVLIAIALVLFYP
ncbi:MAG: LysE family translocator, partial [Flavobacteriaceae bacterium]